jgi:hypothetical protein
LYKSLKDTKLKITPTCFGSYVIHHQGVQSCALLKLLVVIHRYFVVCFVGVWQRNFEPVVCVCVWCGAEIWTLWRVDQKYLDFLIVILGKDGENQLDRQHEK